MIFTKLKADHVSLEEKHRMWERVLGKVEEKFQGRVTEVENAVNGRYNDLLQRELNEVSFHLSIIAHGTDLSRFSLQANASKNWPKMPKQI